MLNREKVLSAFRQALQQLTETQRKSPARPRTVAVRAHALYCAQLSQEEKKPALVTFRKFVSGKESRPEIVRLLDEAAIQRSVRVNLDRTRLYAAFQEAIARLQAQVLKGPGLRGPVRRLEVARQAYEIYAQSLDASEAKPSHLTFEGLVYDKEADPTIQSLIRRGNV